MRAFGSMGQACAGLPGGAQDVVDPAARDGSRVAHAEKCVRALLTVPSHWRHVDGGTAHAVHGVSCILRAVGAVVLEEGGVPVAPYHHVVTVNVVLLGLGLQVRVDFQPEGPVLWHVHSVDVGVCAAGGGESTVDDMSIQIRGCVSA